jgi:activating signal cointegrator complex subunit 2
LEILRNIHKRIFLVFVRMATHKEDPSNEFSPSLYGDLIYSHSLFTIPRLFDLSSLYGSTNTPLLNKMMDNIFTKQPNYMRELGNVIQTNVIDALKDLTQKCTLNPERADVKDICDYVLFYTDITHSLLSLISVYPSVGPVMWDTKICEELITCYEYAIVSCLQEQVKELKIIDKKKLARHSIHSLTESLVT